MENTGYKISSIIASKELAKDIPHSPKQMYTPKGTAIRSGVNTMKHKQQVKTHKFLNVGFQPNLKP